MQPVTVPVFIRLSDCQPMAAPGSWGMPSAWPVTWAVDASSAPIEPQKYCFDKQNKTLQKLDSDYGLAYMRKRLLEKDYNKTLDLNEDTNLDIRDLIRLKKTMSRK